MESFHNAVDLRKFQSTNGIWNRMELNHPMKVGYVSTLIESRPFHTKEEWRDFYYHSGKERLRIAKEQGVDLSLPSQEAKFLNGNYGRTENELRLLGKQMHNGLLKEGNPYAITLSECIYMVKYRIMGETWNGIHLREMNTLKNLQKGFPGIQFKKVSGEIDFNYGIDFELYQNEILICALQIKPPSYQRGTSKAIMEAKKSNDRKNQSYQKIFGRPVFYIYSKSNGQILNTNILPVIETHIQSPEWATS